MERLDASSFGIQSADERRLPEMGTFMPSLGMLKLLSADALAAHLSRSSEVKAAPKHLQELQDG